ncbi:MAG: hypothetical protein WA682_17285, partial [Acidobacteriaceae bacterium]
MSHVFQNTSSVLEASLSGKTGNHHRYATAHRSKQKSVKSPLIAGIVSILCVLLLGPISTPRLAAQ